jgi:hypothetical protein
MSHLGRDESPRAISPTSRSVDKKNSLQGGRRERERERERQFAPR